MQDKNVLFAQVCIYLEKQLRDMVFVSISLLINRYVAEPSLCKDSIKFSSCLEVLLADLQKHWNTPEIEVPTVVCPTQFCHSSPLTDSFNCEAVLIIEMPVLLCLKCILGKFQKSVIFG